ncbi:efflux transporter outer membrane subunit [Aquabacterium sp.]|uniref:efflux transporter outer membrane subunit n=1 Tax=Aquabacterium sp. TaxID=1872578 RepID=UPI002CDCCFAD|nr:efflux transporter outer membrane subunit [Aquabacterium sp.]HSW08662.1 efflux transporter outer membrane subunit [Aquabacterium sp.]
MKRPRLRWPDGPGVSNLTTLTALAAVLSAALVLAGCASPGPAREALKPSSPASLGLAADAVTPTVAADWWHSLGDAKLDALVEQALKEQPSLQVAAARLSRADAGLQGLRAAQGPQLGLGLDVTRQRYSENGLYPPPIAGSQRTSATLQANGSVELDFFGRHAAALQAALGQQRAAQADLAAARVLLAGRVAQAYVGLSRLFGQREVAERTLAQREAMLALTRQRVQAGFDTQVELRQAESAVPEARQQIEALDEQITLTRHQLATLSGQAPGVLATLKPSLQPLQAGPLPERLGADLLGRRPDVVAARWRVEAATQDVALARTQFYPDINLVGFVGLSSLGLDRLLDLGSRNLGVGPALRLPIFDGGRLRAQLRGRGADLDAAIASYNGALLDALREVADAGASLQSLDRQQAQQAQAQAAAESAYDFAQQRYRAGLGTFLTVLSAESSVLAQRRLGVDLKARALDSRIALMRSLGGGWAEPNEGKSE